MDIRSIETIKNELKSYQMSHHIRLRDYNPLSVLSVLNETLAIQIQLLEESIDSEVQSINPLTATGENLDAVIIDRLPAGRQAGTQAVGTITFRRNLPAAAVVTIPTGTQAIALADNGDYLWFETTAVGSIGIGDSSVVVAARSMRTGLNGNIPAYSITRLPVSIDGVDFVENIASYTGGTDEESDDDLRARYIYAVLVPGRATQQLIEQHLTDLETVLEAHTYTRAPGDVEIVVDTTTGIGSTDTDVAACIEENIAAGVVARGVLGASISGGINVELSVCAGGFLYVRPTVHILAEESMTITYTDHLARSRTGTCTIPAGTIAGSAVIATLQDPNDRVVEINGISYVGTSTYDLLMGMGTYPCLYVTPRMVSTNVTVAIVDTATPEVGLAANIESSLTDFLDAYTIGEDLEYSDLVKYIFVDYATGRAFDGIDQITSCVVTGNSTTISSFGQIINLDEDQRIEPGSITITIT